VDSPLGEAAVKAIVSAVFGSLKRQWCDLKKGRPGQRFQERYEQNKRKRADASPLRRWLQPVAGVVLFAAGIVFCIIPGPGLPLLLPGAALLAERSRAMARALDWSEVKVRNTILRTKEWWRHASLMARNAALVAAGLVIAGGGYGAWRVMFGH